MTDNSNSPTTTAISRWFPVGKENWGLDAVTLLAVIGEASIADNAQPMTASMLCLLPRILPAPQALLKPTRPTRLPAYNAKIVGIYNGVCLDSVGFFANIIHPLEDETPYSFKVIEIKHADEHQGRDGLHGKKTSWSSYLIPGGVAEANARARAENRKKVPKPPRTADGILTDGESKDRANGLGVGFATDLEQGSGRDHSSAQAEPAPGIKRRRTAREKVTDFVANPALEPMTRPAVPPALMSPIHIITVLSFIITLVIFGLTAYWRDGNALLAVFIISLQASLVGYASWWKPQLMVRPPHGGNLPPGDMLIRTREGAFILVKCSEEVARELYTGTEECEYHVGPKWYRFLMAVGTMLLMVGVVLLGNTKFNAQAIISASYVLLNGAYWLLGMIPKKYFWDMSRYTWKIIDVPDARDAEKIPKNSSNVEAFPSFTRTLWYAIRETEGHTGWVERSGTAPGTPQWRQWLKEASENAKKRNRTWPAVQRKNEIMKEAAWITAPSGEPMIDDAAQRAPVTEVMPTSRAGVVTTTSAF